MIDFIRNELRQIIGFIAASINKKRYSPHKMAIYELQNKARELENVSKACIQGNFSFEH